MITRMYLAQERLGHAARIVIDIISHVRVALIGSLPAPRSRKSATANPPERRPRAQATASPSVVPDGARGQFPWCRCCAAIVASMSPTVPSEAPRDGRHPVPRRDHVPRLGAARRGRLRHRHVRRLGRRRDAARPRRRRHDRHLVGRRHGRRGRRRVPVHDPHAPTATSRASTRTHARSRTRSATRSCTTTPPSTGATTTSSSRAGTTSSSTSSTSGRSRARPTSAARSTLRGQRLAYLRELGVSAVQVMPPFEFAGDISWGYNPAHLFAIESPYGGPDAFKRFIRDAHAHGIAVIVDVVYNHIGPSDLDLWRFDGWSEGDGGGIYFYNDERARTPWGMTRPDYGRGEVRSFLRDSALTWLEEFRCDGLRFDATVHIRTVDGLRAPGDGRCRRLVVHGLGQRRDRRAPAVEAHDRRGPPGRPGARRADVEGGAGFGAQWDSGVPPRRPAGARRGQRRATGHGRRRGGDHRRGPRRAAQPGHLHRVPRRRRQRPGPRPGVDHARRRRQLVGEEAGGARVGARAHLARDPDAVPGPGAARGPLVRRHRRARLGEGATRTTASSGSTATSSRSGAADATRRRRGLRGTNLHILRADKQAKVLAYHRWDKGGPHDDTVVVANFADRTIDDLRIGLPAPGRWRVRLNSDAWSTRSSSARHEAFDLDADGPPLDGCAPERARLGGAVLGRGPLARGLTRLRDDDAGDHDRRV